MIVCQCTGTRDSEIRKMVREGKGDLRQIGRDCLAGTECGGCRETIHQILLEEQPPPRPDRIRFRLWPVRDLIPHPSQR